MTLTRDSILLQIGMYAGGGLFLLTFISSHWSMIPIPVSTEACPQCGRTRQRFKHEPTPIRTPTDRSYRVEWNDVRFLEKIGIDPEIPEAS